MPAKYVVLIAPATIMHGLYRNTICLFFLSLLCCANADAQAVKLIPHYKDSSLAKPLPTIKASFNNGEEALQYLFELPRVLALKGFATASVDSFWRSDNDLHADIYFGPAYKWIKMRTAGFAPGELEAAGFADKNFANKPFAVATIDQLKERLLASYENKGLPFAQVYLDSVTVIGDSISGTLMVNRGLLYRIDSIRNFGKLRLTNKFLQQYLRIENGSLYSREKLTQIDRRLLELPYAETAQPSSLTMLGTGSILNVNVNNKKASEASAIIGFLPDANNTGKLQITGDVNFDLKNVFGGGEGLLLKFRAQQPQSPRVNLGFEKPYIFKSAFGVNFLFELFKKDSSWVQVSAQGGASIDLGDFQKGSVLFQFKTDNVLQGGIDTNQIKSAKRLPDIIDVRSINTGVNYEVNKTNYRFNPRRGFEISGTALAGIKTIEKNNQIIDLKDPAFDYNNLYDSFKLKSYQVRFRAGGANYFPLGKRSTMKAGLQTGVYLSPNIFRNEVFQIGGYRLLRGFDEEGIYATKFAVLTAEYRSLISLNSYFFVFSDAASVQTKFTDFNSTNFFVSAGLGIQYETKAGLLNLSFAAGKRDDQPFNIRQAAKIHFGYINYF